MLKEGEGGSGGEGEGASGPGLPVGEAAGEEEKGETNNRQKTNNN